MPSLPNCVLLVEDNPIIAMNTEALLEDVGITSIYVASNVAEALAHIETGCIDFAILDLRLGHGEDSLPIAARLAELNVRFVFATGFGEGFDPDHQHGAAGILTKPYRFEDLEKVVIG